MDENLEEMLGHLPDGRNLARNMSLSEGESLGVAPSGDTQIGKEIYKILSSDGVMFTYLRDGDTLRFQNKQKLHR